MTKKHLLTFLITGLCAITSCNQPEKFQLSDVEAWKLGWRMIVTSMEKKYELADLQFDSLLNRVDSIEIKFLSTGLEIKSKLGKNHEIVKILKASNEETLMDICTEPFLSNFKPCFGFSEEKVKNQELQLELIKMYVNDQYIRSNLMNDLLEKYNLAFNEVITDSFGVEVDVRNRNRLKEIIDEYGFPTRIQVGKDAMQGVFYVIQHSDGDKIWQQSQLSNIERAVENGDLDGQSYAYLYDRIQLNRGGKQLYGTQITNVDPINKIVELAPTQDISNLNERRRRIGLMPIELYKESILIILKNDLLAR